MRRERRETCSRPCTPGPGVRTGRGLHDGDRRDHAAIIFEVGVVDGAETPVIVHAMRAREKFLR
jgi:hypothetical protein